LKDETYYVHTAGRRRPNYVTGEWEMEHTMKIYDDSSYSYIALDPCFLEFRYKPPYMINLRFIKLESGVMDNVKFFDGVKK